jgi:hypothetical protein
MMIIAWLGWGLAGLIPLQLILTEWFGLTPCDGLWWVVTLAAGWQFVAWTHGCRWLLAALEDRRSP